MGGVDDSALRAVGGRGVAELDVFGHIVGGQDGHVLVPGAPYLERSVFADLVDDPIVAVLDPPTVGSQSTSVQPGDDNVADASGRAVGKVYPVGADVTGADDVGRGPAGSGR